MITFNIFWVILPRSSLDDFVMCAAAQVILRERGRPNEVFQVSLATAQPRASSRTSGFGTARFSADSSAWPVANDAADAMTDVNSSCLGFRAQQFAWWPFQLMTLAEWEPSVCLKSLSNGGDSRDACDRESRFDLSFD